MWRDGVELQVPVIDLLSCPYAVVESDVSAAMQGIAVVVDCELVEDAVEGELSASDAVGIWSDEGAEVASLHAIFHIVGDIAVSEAHVGHFAVTVGYHNRDDASAKVGEAHLHAAIVAQSIELCGVGFEVDGVKSRESESIGLSSSIIGILARPVSQSQSSASRAHKQKILHVLKKLEASPYQKQKAVKTVANLTKKIDLL